MGILHQVVVFKDGLPVFVIFAVSWVLANKLLDCDLVAIIILEDEIIKVSSLKLLLELNVNVSLAWSLRFSTVLSRYVTISLND